MRPCGFPGLQNTVNAQWLFVGPASRAPRALSAGLPRPHSHSHSH